MNLVDSPSLRATRATPALLSLTLSLSVSLPRGCPYAGATRLFWSLILSFLCVTLPCAVRVALRLPYRTELPLHWIYWITPKQKVGYSAHFYGLSVNSSDFCGF